MTNRSRPPFFVEKIVRKGRPDEYGNRYYYLNFGNSRNGRIRIPVSDYEGSMFHMRHGLLYDRIKWMRHI